MKLTHYVLITIGAALVSIIVGCGPALMADFVLTKGWYSWPSLVIIAYAVLAGGWLFLRIMRGVPTPEFTLRKRSKHSLQEA
jgi:hypothetical protein